jgi:DNA-binding transcriptional regulator YhcF (GntR family)
MPGDSASVEKYMAHVPKYEKVKNQILADIRSGVYQAGDRIPTREQLIKQYSVTRTTVNQALKELVAVGVLSTSKRGGTVVTGKQMPLRVAFVSSFDVNAPASAARGDMDSSNVLRPLLACASEFRLDFLDISKISPADLSIIEPYDCTVWLMPSDQQLEALVKYSDKVLVINRYHDDLNFIATNHRQAVKEMTLHNIEMAGESPQIFFIQHGYRNDFVNRERREGFVDACAEANQFYRVIDVKSSDYDSLLNTLRSVDFEPDRKIVLASPSLFCTGAVLQMARERGFEFNKDIFYSDFDNPYSLRNTGVKVVSAIQDYAGMGAELIKSLHNFGKNKIQIFVPYQLVR